MICRKGSVGGFYETGFPVKLKFSVTPKKNPRGFFQGTVLGCCLPLFLLQFSSDH
jgi:hypothetical protein